MIYLNLFLIAFICVNITDISGVVYSIKSFIAKMLDVRPEMIHIKILECSYCQTWWLSLVYLLSINKLSILNISYILLMCFLTSVIYEFQMTIKDKIITVISKL